jgi:hypothetical protein
VVLLLLLLVVVVVVVVVAAVVVLFGREDPALLVCGAPGSTVSRAARISPMLMTGKWRKLLI